MQEITSKNANKILLINICLCLQSPFLQTLLIPYMIADNFLHSWYVLQKWIFIILFSASVVFITGQSWGITSAQVNVDDQYSIKDMVKCFSFHTWVSISIFHCKLWSGILFPRVYGSRYAMHFMLCGKVVCISYNVLVVL